MGLEFLDKLTEVAVAAGASDLILIEGAPPRIRLVGEVSPVRAEALTLAEMEGLEAACGAEEDHPRSGRGTSRDASFVDSRGNRFRVNMYRSLGRRAAVLRLIRSELPDLHSLGLPAQQIQEWLCRRDGLVLITGPTGSGKSTTLAAAMGWYRAHFARHVITVEDPVEFLLEDELACFSQREVGSDTPSFADGLRSALRQSPDVILVGEIRDAETAAAALQAAETGHLVLSTVHSSSVTEAIDRLTNLFPGGQREGAMHLLSTRLVGLLAQKLLPSSDGGMRVATEFLTNEGATRAWIRENNAPAIQDHLHRSGGAENQSFLQSLVQGVQEGWFDADTAAAASPSPSDLRRALRGFA